MTAYSLRTVIEGLIKLHATCITTSGRSYGSWMVQYTSQELYILNIYIYIHVLWTMEGYLVLGVSSP